MYLFYRELIPALWLPWLLYRRISASGVKGGARRAGMYLFYRELIPALWLAWLIYWRISASGVKAVQRRESPASRAAHIVPLVIGSVLLWMRDIPGGGILFERFLPRSYAAYWTVTALVVLGLAFSVWARMHLGRNWSGTV